MSFSYINVFPNDVTELMNMIGQKNIFKLVFEDVSFSKKYCSPFREDTNPGCFFREDDNGKVWFIDYGDSERIRYDCINAVERKFNMTHREAVEYIKDFFKYKDLNKDDELEIKKEPNRPYSEPIIKPIRYSIRDWTIGDMLFWKPYGISKRQLIEDKVVPISVFSSLDKEDLWYSIRPLNVTYAYNFPSGRVKIYSPFAKKTEFKWFTNCLSSDVGNLCNIDEQGELLIITKSYKDFRVLKNLGYKNTIWVQGETQLLSIEILLSLINKYTKIAVLFDTDEQGNKSGKKLVQLINELKDNVGYQIEIPSKFGEKDISDFYKIYGEKKSKSLIKKLIKQK